MFYSIGDNTIFFTLFSDLQQPYLGANSRPRLVPVPGQSVAQRRSDSGSRGNRRNRKSILPVPVPSIFTSNKKKQFLSKKGKLIPEPGWFPVNPVNTKHVTASPIIAVQTTIAPGFVGIPSPVKKMVTVPGHGILSTYINIKYWPATEYILMVLITI